MFAEWNDNKRYTMGHGVYVYTVYHITHIFAYIARIHFGVYHIALLFDDIK